MVPNKLLKIICSCKLLVVLFWYAYYNVWCLKKKIKIFQKLYHIIKKNINYNSAEATLNSNDSKLIISHLYFVILVFSTRDDGLNK